VHQGMSLLEWSIREAQKSRLKDALLVSTEDAELAQIAARCGVQVAHRPAELAQDNTTTAAVVADLLQEHEADVITILQATSPLRQAVDIDAALALFESGEYDSVVSGCVYNGPHPAKLYMADGRGVRPVAPEFEIARRQDLPLIYQRNGAIFMVKAAYFKQTGALWGGNTAMLKMPVERSVDVDSHADLEAARKYLEANG
jgi:CMP-N,N'-diacetyllegionaminic acid synthase